MANCALRVFQLWMIEYGFWAGLTSFKIFFGNKSANQSLEILAEYCRVSEELAIQFPGVDLNPILELVSTNGELVEAATLDEAVCDDPDDNKFFACAIAGGVDIIISGDQHLLKRSGYQGIEVVRPRQCVDNYLC